MTWNPYKQEGGQSNEQRARNAKAGLIASEKKRGCYWGTLSEDSVSDLLTDLMHYCDRESLVFDQLLQIARLNYKEEK